MIKVNNISKVYKKKDSEFYANRNISFEIAKGDIVGFLGGNGAGKTTLIKSICNLIIPSEGNIEIDGKDVKLHPHIVHDKVGVLLEGARNLYNFLTIEENANYFSYLNEIDSDKFEDNKNYYLKLFDLYEKRHEAVNNLSRGMQQKVAIMVAILKDPDVLILDEPTLGLDIVSKLRMQDVLKKLAKEFGKTLIISSHDMSVIEDICDKVAIINKGELVAYDSIHALTFNEEDEYFKFTVAKKQYVEEYIHKEKVKIIQSDDEVFDFIHKDVQSVMKEIKPADLIKMEKHSKDIESILKGLGGKNENN